MTTVAAPVSRMLTINGLQLHHLDWGNQDAPPLVCVHGLRSNAHAFDGFAHRFSDRYHVVSMDVRGRGDSAWSPEGAYRMTDYAADLVETVNQLGFTTFSYIGTSMGGRIGMQLAIDHGDRLERFILNDIGPDGEAGSDRITREAGSTPDSFESFEAALDYQRKTFGAAARMSEEALRERAQHAYRQREDGRWIDKCDPEFIRQRAQNGMTHDPAQFWTALARLQCPTLVLWGTVSDVLSEGQARKIVQTVRNGTLAPVPGAGHTPTLVEPESVEALEQFLGR